MRKKLGGWILLVLLAQLVIFLILYFNLASFSLSPETHKSFGEKGGLKRKLHVSQVSAPKLPLVETRRGIRENVYPLMTPREDNNNPRKEGIINRILNQSDHPDSSVYKMSDSSQISSSIKNGAMLDRNTPLDVAEKLKSHTSPRKEKSIVNPISAERLKRLKPESILRGMNAESDPKEDRPILGEERRIIRAEIRERDKGLIDDGQQPKRKFSVRKTMRDMERERAEELKRLRKEDFKNKGNDRQRINDALSRNTDANLNQEDYFRELCETTNEPLVECSTRRPDQLASAEDIMFTIRTTLKYHEVRLPVMMDTWLGDVEPGSVFIVTDGDDEDLQWKTNTLGMNYVNIQSGKSHNRSDLCCKAGVELELLLSPENSKFNWVCHIDDDMYINPLPLARTLSRFKPKKEEVYFGRSGSPWGEPWKVKEESRLGTPGRRYHFAVGGMYCLSRAMLESARPYLVGCRAFEKSCFDTKEPEDVTVGLIIGTVLDEKLYRTEMIYTHGLDLLSLTPTLYLKDQIAFSYGFGAEGAWTVIPNVVYVHGGLFNIDEDMTQFKSLHCHFFPKIEWCLEKKLQVAEDKKRRENNRSEACECCWKKIICCNVYRDNYAKFVQAKAIENRRQMN